MKRYVATFIVLIWATHLIQADVFDVTYEHHITSEVTLNGAWEMAYVPYAWETVDEPDVRGVRVSHAIPGNWEDMEEELRDAACAARKRAAEDVRPYRRNPFYRAQHFPLQDWADDTTLNTIRGTFIYRRQMVLDDGHERAAEDVRPYLACPCVRNEMRVWINGIYVGRHVGYSTPFEIGIRADILKSGTNDITLAVSNDPVLGYGDEVVGLTSRALFRGTGGIEGGLALRFAHNALGDVYVTTARDGKTFTIHTKGNVPYRYAISEGGKILRQGQATDGDVTLPTEGLSCWTPERPTRLALTLETAAGKYTQLFGIRRLTASGEKLLLNGKPIYLRGVTEHCYFPKTIHLPRDIDYYRMITRKRKELGFNFVRFHTFIPPEEYLEATDELGMLVHLESPNFTSEPEFEAIIAFARRHPSVVIYCTGNETRIDRLAERYLEDIANMVHADTDALFSPMSAMRAVEYALMPGCDDIVRKPFMHNRARLDRLGKFCDLYTSYQIGATSYDSLNSPYSAADLDAWGDIYRKPRTSHEICIDSSYIDFSLEKLYPTNSPILKVGLFAEPRRHLAEKGLLDRAPRYFLNSCKWMHALRKFTFEKLRAADRVVGFDFLGDINTHWHTFGYSVGMMDEFYRLKPGTTPEEVRQYNSAAVVLADFGSNFISLAGTSRVVRVALSNYASEISGVRVMALLQNRAGEIVWRENRDVGTVPNGCVSHLTAFTIPVPACDVPTRWTFRVRVVAGGGGVVAENAWEIFGFPRVVAGGVRGPGMGCVRVVEDITAGELRGALARGERVVLLGKGPFKALPVTYRIGMAGRCSGNFATVVKYEHPAVAGMPSGDWCGWDYRYLMEGAHAIQLEADVPFDPIIDIAASVKCAIRQTLLSEYRVGPGRLLICGLNFHPDDPAAQWLKARICHYAETADFAKDAPAITDEQLAAILAAPLVSGATGNANRARNPGDPSGDVRAGIFAQP